MALQLLVGSTPACKRRSICGSTCSLSTLCLHNLKLVLEVAMEDVTETGQFYDTIESVYNFF